MPKLLITILFSVFVLLGFWFLEAQQAHESEGAMHKLICTTVPAGKIVKRVSPILPPQVKAKAIADGVVIQVTIDSQGVPKDIHVTKGDSTLAKAAEDAVRQWRWKPCKLNGEPVEVESSIYIKFEPSED